MAASPELEQVSRPRAARPLGGRSLLVEAGVGAAFAGAAAAIAVAGSGNVRWGVAAVLVAAFAVALRAQFDVGPGYVPPTQLVFIPALFLEPPRVAPLIALAGWGLGRLPDVVSGELHVSRLAKVPANCWFAIGPAAVLIAAGSPALSWGDWPLYVGALAAQFAGDLGSGVLREWLELGVAPRLQLRGLVFVWLVDAALSPVGLLAAFASLQHRYAFLGVLPLAALLAVFSGERSRRFEAELAGARTREALIAGASHELRTPLTVLSGLIEALRRAPDMDAARRAEVLETMRRQAGQLSHLVGQFIDYAELKAGRELEVRPRPVEVAGALAEVAALWEADVRLASVDGARSVLADPAALHAVLMALMSNALRHGPPEGPVELSARVEGRDALVEVADRGPGLAAERLETVFAELPDPERAEGSGLGLYLAREVMRAQGGDVRLANRGGGGLVATVRMPLADS